MLYNKYKFQIGDKVTFHSAGRLWGIVVDYYGEKVYTVAFPSGREINFRENDLYRR